MRHIAWYLCYFQPTLFQDGDRGLFVAAPAPLAEGEQPPVPKQVASNGPSWEELKAMGWLDLQREAVGCPNTWNILKSLEDA